MENENQGTQEPAPAKKRPAGIKRDVFAKIAVLIAMTRETIQAEKLTSVDLAKRLGDTLGYYVHEATARKAAIVANVPLVVAEKRPGKIKAMQAEIAELKAKLVAMTMGPESSVTPLTRTNRKPTLAHSSAVLPPSAGFVPAQTQQAVA